MVYEMRQYRIRPGQREHWIEFMEGTIIPFFVEKGIVIVASFLGTEEQDLYVWIRRFDSDEQRQRLRKAQAESEYWQHHIAPRLPELIDTENMLSTWLEPTAMSVIH